MPPSILVTREFTFFSVDNVTFFPLQKPKGKDRHGHTLDLAWVILEKLLQYL